MIVSSWKLLRQTRMVRKSANTETRIKNPKRTLVYLELYIRVVPRLYQLILIERQVRAKWGNSLNHSHHFFPISNFQFSLVPKSNNGASGSTSTIDPPSFVSGRGIHSLSRASYFGELEGEVTESSCWRWYRRDRSTCTDDWPFLTLR